jgi:hypothetical protein
MVVIDNRNGICLSNTIRKFAVIVKILVRRVTVWNVLGEVHILWEGDLFPISSIPLISIFSEIQLLISL